MQACTEVSVTVLRTSQSHSAGQSAAVVQVWVQMGPLSLRMHRPVSHAAGPKEQSEPALPPPLGKQTDTSVTPSELKALRHANPSGHEPLGHVMLHTRAVPRSRQVPLWHGARPGEQSSPKRPPIGAQTPMPFNGPLAERRSGLQS